MKDKAILIAHGTDTIRMILKTTLRDAGYHYISTAETGRQIFARLERNDYDLLITAPELPGINCWQLLRVIGTGAFCSPTLPLLIICNANQISLIKPLAQEHHASLLALDELEKLTDSIHACLSGLKKPTVLVIEDHQNTAQLIESSLKARFEVDITPSGEAGLDAWRVRQHHLILLDLMLPGMHGPEVLARIMTEKPSQLVAIITARSERKTHRSMILSGATAFLTKPVDFQKLPRFCEKLLHDGALLNQRAQLETQGQSTSRIVEHVQFANFLLETGHVGRAAEQIKHALAQRQEKPFHSDDEWIQLLTKLDYPGT